MAKNTGKGFLHLVFMDVTIWLKYVRPCNASNQNNDWNVNALGTEDDEKKVFFEGRGDIQFSQMI